MTKQIKVNNIVIDLPTLSNHDAYYYIQNNRDLLVEAVIPQYWDEELGRWEDNPYDPIYDATLQFQTIHKGQLIFEWICSQSNFEIPNPDELEEEYYVYNSWSKKGFSFEVWYLTQKLLTTKNLMATVVDNVLLTERSVANVMSGISITRQGFDIFEFPLKNQVDSRIELEPIICADTQLVNPLHEYSCCIESNLSWNSWYSCEDYDLEFKASALAYYRLHKIQQSHIDDAVAIESEKKVK